MDEFRQDTVAKVEAGQVEEVDDEDKLSEDEVRTDKQHDPCEQKEVRQNKVTSNSGSSVPFLFFVRKESQDVVDLTDEDDQPIECK